MTITEFISTQYNSNDQEKSEYIHHPPPLTYITSITYNISLTEKKGEFTGDISIDYEFKPTPPT